MGLGEMAPIGTLIGGASIAKRRVGHLWKPRVRRVVVEDRQIRQRRAVVIELCLLLGGGVRNSICAWKEP